MTACGLQTLLLFCLALPCTAQGASWALGLSWSQGGDGPVLISRVLGSFPCHLSMPRSVRARHAS
jgi:hypothetical protein